MNYAEESLKLHYQWKGKLDTVPKMKVENSDDLSLAYTPGVAQPVLKSRRIPASAMSSPDGATPLRSLPTAPLCWVLGISVPKRACR